MRIPPIYWDGQKQIVPVNVKILARFAAVEKLFLRVGASATHHNVDYRHLNKHDRGDYWKWRHDHGDHDRDDRDRR